MDSMFVISGRKCRAYNMTGASIVTTGPYDFYPGTIAMVRYECLPYHVHTTGDLNRTCLYTGSWTGSNPACQGKFNCSVGFRCIQPPDVFPLTETSRATSSAVSTTCFKSFKI